MVLSDQKKIIYCLKLLIRTSNLVQFYIVTERETATQYLYFILNMLSNTYSLH